MDPQGGIGGMSQLIGANPLEPIQLFPLRYPWAYAHALQGKRNTWFPEEVPLGEDVRDWELRLTPEERHGVEILLGFFNPMESLVTHNLVLSRSEEHTSELQSRENLVCRLLLEKKK